MASQELLILYCLMNGYHYYDFNRQVFSISGLDTENAAVGIRHADHATPLYLQKLALTSPTSGGRLVGIVGSRTQATEFSF
jgi:hypothetical protein